MELDPINPNPRCEYLSHPDIANFGLSIFILVGILVSYLPQHAKIILRRSSEGLSPWFVLLGTTSGTCAIANILVLPASHEDIACCSEIDGFACGAALLGIAQVGVQWSCFFLIMLLFLVFFPRDGTTASTDPDPEVPDTTYTYKHALAVVALSIAHFFAVFLVSVILLARFPEQLQLWANILGIMATCLASIQYLPQIYTTWKLQDVKSLSIPMMLIQTPGSFVFATSLAIRLGKSGWSAWGVYIVTGILQGVLLGMGIWFFVRDRRAMRKGEVTEGPNGRSDEQTPLLDPPANQANGRG
ncbi:PQ loop repeat protein-like protein [Saccharata proteae CBS 121410]|uniref:PQ loop repeat protein-like protein n=1 Tax=Saccharata proteae CBS 121410 TaxID=1314787 RepID=A0A9P4HPX6_9PEZI|nr:PQ loop repeat protein-like protein [Saccharata proteae CBS 121410]